MSTPYLGVICTGGPTMSTPYQGVTPRQLSFQTPGAAQTSVTSMPTSGLEFTFSNKHRGLCLYVARILRYVNIIAIKTPWSVFVCRSYSQIC